MKGIIVKERVVRKHLTRHLKLVARRLNSEGTSELDARTEVAEVTGAIMMADAIIRMSIEDTNAYFDAVDMMLDEFLEN